MKSGSSAYISLGSNVGDRVQNLRYALKLLGDTPGVSVSRASHLYETEPVGVREQPWFLNGVVEVLTDLPPRELLAVAKQVERVVGRAPSYRWGPREVDVDILTYGDLRWNDEDLTIPHPRMTERLFVLEPLMELVPDWRNEAGMPIADLIEGLKGSAVVRPYPELLS